MSKKRQLPSSLSDAQRPIILLPIIAAQQLVLLPLYFYIPLWVVAFNLCLSLLAYRFSIKPESVFSNLLKWVITLLALAGILYTFQRVTGRDAGVALIAVMYGLKIIEIKKRRDVYVLMILGFFILLAGFLFQQSPLMAIYQVIPIIAILHALTSIHLVASGDNNRARTFAGNWRNIKKLVIYTAYAFPLMLILFVFFPRLSGPIWKMPGQSNAVSGISETMSPGAISSLQLFDTVAFRVKFLSKAPSEEQMYWRTLTLDHFDGFTWSRSKSQSSRRLHETTVEKNAANTLGFYQYDISLERTRQKWLTLLDRPSHWPVRSVLFSDYSVQADQRVFKRTRYRASSEVGKLIDVTLSEKERAHFLELPAETNKRSLLWAKQERLKYQTEQDYIFGLLRRIHIQPYYYTLTPPIMERETVDSFWFDHKKGFCEHYAGSLVFMARAADIPARVVVGYQGGDANPIADYWIVRYADAHAWTEIWFKGKGWIRIDPTAAIASSRVEEQLRMDYSQRQSLFGEFAFDAVDLEHLGWIKHMKYWVDQLNSGWNDWVLDFNRDSQRSLFKTLGLGQFKRSQVSLMMILFVMIILAGISYRWMRDRPKLNPMERSLELLMSKIAVLKITLEPNEGIEDFIRRIEGLKQSASDQFNGNGCANSNKKSAAVEPLEKTIELLLHYQKLSYAQSNLSLDQQKDFHKEVKSFRI